MMEELKIEDVCTTLNEIMEYELAGVVRIYTFGINGCRST